MNDADEMKAVEEAVRLLKKALPGFEALIVPERQAVRIMGALPIGGQFTYEALLPVLYDLGGNPKVEAIVKQVQDLAIHAVGLAPVIAEQVDRALDRGRSAGYSKGYAAGRAEIASVMADVLAAERRNS